MHALCLDQLIFLNLTLSVKELKLLPDKTAFSQAQRNCKTKTTAENLNIETVATCHCDKEVGDSPDAW